MDIAFSFVFSTDYAPYSEKLVVVIENEYMSVIANDVFTQDLHPVACINETFLHISMFVLFIYVPKQRSVYLP